MFFACMCEVQLVSVIADFFVSLLCMKWGRVLILMMATCTIAGVNGQVNIKPLGPMYTAAGKWTFRGSWMLYTAAPELIQCCLMCTCTLSAPLKFFF